MDTDLVRTFIMLFQMICVVMVFAYLFTRSRFFTEVLEKHPGWKTQILLSLIFGLLSIYGMNSGVSV